MPSTFKCPYCQSQYNKWISDEEKPGGLLNTYQCKDCLNLFEIFWNISDDSEDDEYFANLM